ncbi:MAG: isoleucine--tRNA ligase [Lentisphaerae bacterium RIFOXYB12_FULL_65_16]|nr:MAG: isoleucine--tRNA ligase [Lentisphaerae bacterium RIFOXYA12_64_32]OGV86026.1 MAG: isoleucine--tRNA ligase [Lentisphaerae bacterium RIFOXYB12_FULL_65_16]
MFDPVKSQVSFSEMETTILKFWREHRTFEKSLELRRDQPKYVFYDGPPFATGLPHYGHLLAGTLKDVVPRYQTMCGRYVDRTFGWDCHGLPVENEVEKELGICSKHEIEAYGVARFNEACRSIVLRYTQEWENIVERMGRWVDFRRGYRTMDLGYMESIWWVFKQLWDKGLIYEGHKILPYCPRCATPLSNFEANQGYEEVKDPSITLRFQSATDPHRFFLAWTTTPWTLPSNTGLAVHPEVEYVCIQDGADQYIMAAARVDVYYKNQAPNVVERFPGARLVGQRYVPLFPDFAHLAAEGAFRIVPAAFVSTEDGTGIVHMAPGFGEEDAEVARREGLPMVCPIDAECRFTADVPDYAGKMVKDADDDIMRRLKHEGKLIHKTTCQHSYPHCWRCESPLIYRAVSTWFVRVESIKEKMLQANAQIHWVPEHLRDGRFGKWLENVHDWAVSRNRYWGCPLPVWRSEDGSETICVGSVAELEQLSGKHLDDIHKHYVDDLQVPSSRGLGTLRRVPQVLDCWFESGSMPYAQHHYPFENKAHVEAHFPADFIAEGLDQTRGWFYTLVVLGAALFDKPPFRNVVVNGLVLAEDGRKMSKRLKNYPDPMEIMNHYGADALRLCLLSSPVVRAEDLRFSEKAVREVMRTVILPLWNAYSFFVTYARVDNWRPAGPVAQPPAEPAHLLDRWVLSRLEDTTRQVRVDMDNYDLQRAALRFTGFIEDLTNWYIRRSRRRFWKSQNDTDKAQAYETLHYVLVTFSELAAPFIPFVTESMYRNLRTPQMPESVHLCDYPRASSAHRDERLNQCMAHTMSAVSLGRYLRTQANLRVRQPLAEATLVAAADNIRDDLQSMSSLIAEELNVRSVRIRADEEDLVELSCKANFKKLGPKLGARMRAAAATIEKMPTAQLATLRKTGEVSVDIGDEQLLRLTTEDVTIQRREKEGLSVANEGDITVALDTRLSDSLIREGWAREIVSRVQNMRKDADLQVTDRIVVTCQLPPDGTTALAEYDEYVRNETLADRVTTGTLPDAEPVDINGQECRFAIARA